MVIGIDHGYYAIKTKQVCFPLQGLSAMNMSLIRCRVFFSIGESIMSAGLGGRP